MTHSELLMWWTIAILGTLCSALISGTEIGLYTLNRVRLHVLAHSGRRSAVLLEKMLADPNHVLGSLLVGNNIANYLVSLAVSALMSQGGVHGWTEILIDIAILTPVLLIFGEVLPKDLFRSNSDVMTYWMSRPLNALRLALTFTGVLPLIDGITRLIQRVLHGSDATADMTPRRTVMQLMKEGVGHGVITAYQSEMMNRVLDLNRLTLEDVMLPWAEVQTLRTTQGARDVWAFADRLPFARVPLLDVVGRPIGMLEINKVLEYDPAVCPPLETLADPLPSLPPNTSLQRALKHLQQEGAALVLVKDKGKPLGVVTAKDLVEPIVGDLVAW